MTRNCKVGSWDSRGPEGRTGKLNKAGTLLVIMHPDQFRARDQGTEPTQALTRGETVNVKLPFL